MCNSFFGEIRPGSHSLKSLGKVIVQYFIVFTETFTPLQLNTASKTFTHKKTLETFFRWMLMASGSMNHDEWDSAKEFHSIYLISYFHYLISLRFNYQSITYLSSYAMNIYTYLIYNPTWSLLRNAYSYVLPLQI